MPIVRKTRNFVDLCSPHAGVVNGHRLNRDSCAPRVPAKYAVTLCRGCGEIVPGKGEPTTDSGLMLGYCPSCRRMVASHRGYRDQCQSIFDRQRETTKANIARLRAALG